MTQTISIAGRKIGASEPPYVIAELSGNHNGSLERAITMIDAAAATGADAIKIQTYTPDTITIKSNRPEFRIKGGLWDGRSLYELYAEAQTPFEWHNALFAHAKKRGITLFSSPFDPTAVALLSGLDAPAYKIASFEAVDLPLIQLAARTGKPLIISTGMCNLGEIGEAVDAARQSGKGGVALLHCTSAYPAPFSDANVRTIPHLASAFDVVAGLSDHTPGTATAVAAVAMGAAIIEKHFTLARADGGPDAAFSLEPHEFKALVDDCRHAHAALGRVTYDLEGSEKGSIVFRRSLYAVAPIARGAAITDRNVRSIRPGYGLAPKYMPQVLSMIAARDIAEGEPLSWDLLARKG